MCEDCRREIARIAGEGRALSERQSQLAHRIQAWRASAQEESARSASLSQQLAARRMELSQVEATQAELAQRAQDAQRELAARSETLAEARQRRVPQPGFDAGLVDLSDQVEHIIGERHVQPS